MTKWTVRRSAAVAAAVAAGLVAATMASTPAQAVPNRTLSISGGTNTIGHEFEHSDFGGSVLTVQGGSTACSGTTSDVDYQTTDLPYGGIWPARWWWDNIISSFNNEDNCFTKHFTDENYGGAADPEFRDDRASMVNGMNDVANSVRWS
jgi:hypothetical protein